MKVIRGTPGKKLDVSASLAACRSAAFSALATILASVPAAYGQQASPQQMEKAEKAGQAQLVKKPEPPHLPDIVSDNLDRVSATTEQILQIVDRDPGMMVELKRLFAEDAGTSGQILEETDLTDAAISDRLGQDLHTRVIATHLLQRYGYLLPKVNPDSDLATEHNLKMRARVQELERAAEPHETSPAAPQTVITVGSSPSIEPSTNRGRPLRQPLSDEAGVLNNTMSPGMLSTDPEGHLSLVKAQSRESTPSALPERVNPSFPAEVAGLGSTDMPLSLAPRSPRTAMAPIAEVEPVRMDRRPNPYADVPSLYDLYVQANARSEKVERFGIEVFRNGAADPDGRLARAFERFTCSKALAVVCLCQGFIDRLRERGVAPEKLHLIPDWGNSAPVPASAQDAGFRDVHAIPPEVFLAMHTGNMGKKQNLQNLVRAAQLSRQDSGLLWLLVGDGEERATLEQEILQHNLTNIRLLPLQPPEAVPQMYAAADALLLNQRSAVEDAVIPSKLLTYMSSGRAVVAAVSDRSEAARQVRRADCGVLVPAENPDALLEGVNELRRAPALRQRLGRNGRAFAEAHFTKSRVLQSYESLFAALGFPVAERVRVASHAAAD